MKKNRQLLSNLIFFAVIFALAIGMSTCQAGNYVKTLFGDEILGISSSVYSMNISYEDVLAVELAEAVDFGTVVDGKNKPELRGGVWKNELWGEYHLCAVTNATNCVVVHMKDGQVFVFSSKNNDITKQLYEELLSRVDTAPTT